MSDDAEMYQYFVAYTGIVSAGHVVGEAILSLDRAVIDVEALNWIRAKILADKKCQSVVLTNIIRLPI